MSRAAPDYFAGDLFGEIHHAENVPDTGRRDLSWQAYVPGLLLAGTAACAAGFLANAYAFPLILLGLLIGLALSFMAEDERTAPGLDFLSRHALRIGIVLLGLQVTFSDAAALGVVAFAGLFAVMLASVGAAILAARIFAQPREAGILAGGATAICGASAALALYGVIGRERLDQARFTVTLMGVALASALVMAATPLIAQYFSLSETQAGFLIGASVHDAGQAIGGAYSYSDTAGEAATIVKLARVAMLAPVVAIVALWISRTDPGNAGSKTRVAVPWFIVLFLLVVAVNSVIAVPAVAAQNGLLISKVLLLLAVTATAIRSRLGLLVGAGLASLMPIICASLVSLGTALVIAMMVMA